MKLFVVTEEGVYRHRILGVYVDFEKAIERAKEFALSSVDDYHSYDVSKCESDEDIDDVDRLATIYRCDKGYTSYNGAPRSWVKYNPPKITVEYSKEK